MNRYSGNILAAVTAALAVASAPAWAQVSTYTATHYSKVRTFDFGGAAPFVNSAIGQSDMATIQFNGQTLSSYQIPTTGSGTFHIQKIQDPSLNEQVTRVLLSPGDALTAGSHRVQLNSYGIEKNKRYVLDLEFKLDSTWNLAASQGKGLVWQLKGVQQTYQYGNPVLALVLQGDQLRMVVSYPTTAKNATSWPTQVSWAQNQYEPVTLPARTLVPGQYHRIQLEFFADDKPAQFVDTNLTGGQGYIKATFDDQTWFNYTGPTLHPDQKKVEDQESLHAMKWGWYQWDAAPVNERIVYFRKNRLSEWK